MNSLDFGMVHSCQVIQDTGTTQDNAGSPIKNLVYTSYKCLFSKVSSSGNYITNTNSGKIILSSVMVFLPALALVEKGDFITTNEPNWSGIYEVQDCDAPENVFTRKIDHLEAFLKEATKRD